MEHWSIERRGIQNCSAGCHGKIVSSKSTIHSDVFWSWFFQYFTTPALPQKGSYINNPLPGVTKAGPSGPGFFISLAAARGGSDFLCNRHPLKKHIDCCCSTGIYVRS